MRKRLMLRTSIGSNQSRGRRRMGISTGIAALLLVLTAAVLGGGASTAQAGPPQDAVLDWNRYAVEALVSVPTATPPTPDKSPRCRSCTWNGAGRRIRRGQHDRRRSRGVCGRPSVGTRVSVRRRGGGDGGARRARRDGDRAGADTGDRRPRLHGLHRRLARGSTAADGPTARWPGSQLERRLRRHAERQPANDGRIRRSAFTAARTRGLAARAVPVCATPPHDPNAWVARVDPFVMTSESQFRTKGPPRRS